jgi:hypothetical protein
MKHTFRFHYITSFLLVITCLAAISPKAQTYYSGFASPSSGTHYTYSTGGICIGCGMSNPSNAASSSLTDSTSIYMTVGIGNTISARLKLTDTAETIAGVVIRSNTGLLNASVLSAVVLKTYYKGTLQETFAGGSVLGLSLLGGSKQRIEASASKKFNEVELVINNAISAIWDVNLFYAYGITITPLPIQQYTLQANVRENNSVLLSWSVNDAGRYKQFHIMHSANGSSFTELRSLEVALNNEGSDTFNYVHQALQPGKHYYFIKMEDMQGKVTATSVISQSLSISKLYNHLVRMFPNPAVDYISINFPEEAIAIRILNNVGELIYEQAGDIGLSTEINIGQWMAGAYLVQVETQDGNTGRQVFIKN